jgi:transposase
MNYAKIINESEEELKRIEKKQKLVQFQRRVRYLLLLKKGTARTQEEAGQEVGLKIRQSQKIWRLYRVGGLEAVLNKPNRWGFGKLSSHQISELQKYLTLFGANNLMEVCKYIEQSFGVFYTESGISALCFRLKIKLKTARPSNANKDIGKGETYKKTLAN